MTEAASCRILTGACVHTNLKANWASLTPNTSVVFRETWPLFILQTCTKEFVSAYHQIVQPLCPVDMTGSLSHLEYPQNWLYSSSPSFFFLPALDTFVQSWARWGLLGFILDLLSHATCGSINVFYFWRLIESQEWKKSETCPIWWTRKCLWNGHCARSDSFSWGHTLSISSEGPPHQQGLRHKLVSDINAFYKYPLQVSISVLDLDWDILIFQEVFGNFRYFRPVHTFC